MRRIANFDPSVAGTNPTIEVGAADAGSKVLLYNLSPRNLDLDFYNGNNSVLHAWEARYWTLDGETREIGWSLDSIINVTNAPPISLVMGELYSPQEQVEGTFPISLMHQTSVGNPVSTNVTGASTLVNTGNPSNTNVATVSSTAAAGNAFTLTNDGLMALLVTIAGALVQVFKTFEPGANGTILQEGAATYVTEQLGNLLVDGTLTAKGATTLAAAAVLTHILGALTVDQAVTLSSTLAVAGELTASTDLKTNVIRDNVTGADQIDLATAGVTFNNAATHKGSVFGPGATTFTIDSNGVGIIQLKVNGVNICQITSTGLTLNAGNKINLLTNSISRIVGQNAVTCGSGTVITHGLGASPVNVSVTPAIAQPGSATVGVNNVGATTFTATVGAGTACAFLAYA